MNTRTNARFAPYLMQLSVSIVLATSAPRVVHAGTVFVRADVNADGRVSISDALTLGRYLENP